MDVVSAVVTECDITACFVCQINRVVNDHISHADMTASDVANTWTLIASDGDMKVYKSEVGDTGAVVQHPLKAVHTVKVRLFPVYYLFVSTVWDVRLS